MPSYQFYLLDPTGTVTVLDGDQEIIYKHGDTFIVPRGWKYDAEFSTFVKKPTFSFETRRQIRNPISGKKEWSIDVKRVSLPLIIIEEEHA